MAGKNKTKQRLLKQDDEQNQVLTLKEALTLISCILSIVGKHQVDHRHSLDELLLSKEFIHLISTSQCVNLIYAHSGQN